MYDKSGDQLNRVVQEHSALVKRIAHHMCARLPSCVQVEDLVQAGMMGLIEAWQNYDPSQGAQFETFAGIRIKGAMLDDMRKGDWVPRSVHRSSREINEAINEVEHKLGRAAHDEEVANHLGISLQDYQRTLADVNNSRLVGDGDLPLPLDAMLDYEQMAPASEPHKGLLKQEFIEALSNSIDQLKDREKAVLALYYNEELNLKEIGDVLSVTESRISQLHGTAVNHLRTDLGTWHDEQA